MPASAASGPSPDLPSLCEQAVPGPSFSISLLASSYLCTEPLQVFMPPIQPGCKLVASEQPALPGPLCMVLWGVTVVSPPRVGMMWVTAAALGKEPPWYSTETPEELPQHFAGMEKWFSQRTALYFFPIPCFHVQDSNARNSLPAKYFSSLLGDCRS